MKQLKRIKWKGEDTDYVIDCDGNYYKDFRKKENEFEDDFSNLIKMKPGILKSGYHLAQITFNKKKRNLYIHRLVAENFVGPLGKLEVNHKDFDKGNNNYMNLEIVTKKVNMKHYYDSKKIHLKKSHEIIKKTFDGKFICKYDSAKVACKIENMTIENVRNRCRRTYNECYFSRVENGIRYYYHYDKDGKLIKRTDSFKEMGRKFISNRVPIIFFQDRFTYGRKIISG